VAAGPDGRGLRGMTVRDILREAAAAFAAAGLTNPRLDAEVLLAHCLQKERLFLFAYPEHVLTETQACQYRTFVMRRVSREPVAYLVGRKEFWSLPLQVDRRVLIPRPETEILVEEALKIAAGFDNVTGKILDVGVGSGAISIVLAAELKNVRLFAVDISRDAVTVARNNAEALDLRDRIAFVVGNLTDCFSGIFDMIVSNPPYIATADFASLPKDVREFEPSSALLGGPRGLSFHRELMRAGGARLKGGGWLIMEIGAGQAGEIEKMFRMSRLFDEIRFRADYAGIDRVALARRC